MVQAKLLTPMPPPKRSPLRRRPPPASFAASTTTTTTAALSSRLFDAATSSSPRLLLPSLALLVTSALSSSHRPLASRLLNSLLRLHPLLPASLLLRLLPPDHLTLPLLSRLFAPSSLPFAFSLHALALSSGHLPADLSLSNSLLSLYFSFCSPSSARRLLADIPHPDLVTWNTLLHGCVKHRLLHAARRVFDEMPERDVITYNSMLSGYAAAGDVEDAKKLFDSMPEKDVVSWNAMMDGYARAGDVGMARKVFDAMPEKSVVSWNVVLAVYARARDWRECLRLFDAMVAVGDVRPNEKTFVSVLTACGNLGDLERGRWVHCLVRKRWERLVPDVLLLTALFTMYAKCGVMESAREIFDSMKEKSVPSWNSMIIGYGLHGKSVMALELFLEMERSGPRPNETTFICILSSCAHGGMVLEGWWCFDRMVRFYSIEPKVEHLGCMMDLLGRAGLLRDSENLVESLQGKVSPALWGALMSASQTQNNWKLGEFVGKKLIEMKPAEVGPYVLLSNIYAAEGRWDDVEKVRELMKENGLEKDVGLSLVGTNDSASQHVEQESVLVCQKGMMLSMLSEMSSNMKLPSK